MDQSSRTSEGTRGTKDIPQKCIFATGPNPPNNPDENHVHTEFGTGLLPPPVPVCKWDSAVG